MTDISNDLGKMLKQQRLVIPLTLRELSAVSGVSSSHLGRIETGTRFPSARVLQKLARPLGFEETHLLTLAGYISTPSPTAVGNESDTWGLDPYVASVLAKKPVEIQRAVIGILSMLGSIAKGYECNIEFAEYAHKKYPQLDEDTITLIEDVINREAPKVVVPIEENN